MSRANSSAHAELFSIDMLPVSAIEWRMVAASNLVEVAALVGDTARATILAALMSGQALTAGELAALAGISKSTASEHLAKLETAKLVAVAAEGRFKYYRIGSQRVAAMLESIIAVAAIDVPPRYRPRSAKDDALRNARTCYDHLAGRLGVRLTDALTKPAYIELSEDGGVVTPSGVRFLTSLGIAPQAQRRSKRLFCRPCLDWSERRFHIAGFLGAELCHVCFERKWVRRLSGSRAVAVTSDGLREFKDLFGFDPTSEDSEPVI
jgi:DNA-binding transcriptional ArsR family regulator